MQIISQFLDNLNTLSNNIFQTTTFLEPLALNKKLSTKLEVLLSDSAIADSIDSVQSSIIELNKLLSPIVSTLQKEISKKHIHKDMIPYASFRVDEPPIVKDNSEKNVQLSFEDIINNNDIKPINRTLQLKLY